MLSFANNKPVKIFSKGTGSNPDLWGVMVDGRRGYINKHHLQEQRVYARDLKFTVPTEFNQVAKEEESKEAEVEKQEESKEVLGEEKNTDDKKEKKNKGKKNNDLKGKKNNDLKENKRNQKIDENTGKEEASNQYIPSATTEQVQIEEQKIEAEKKIQENSEEN